MADVAWRRWLSLLGGLPPSAVRERVYEPVCWELARSSLERGASQRLLGPRFFAVLVWVAIANFPRVLVERRRPSGVARVLGSAALVGLFAALAAVLVLRSRYGG